MAMIPTRWQEEVLNAPEDVNLALFGGRGAGRTTGALFLTARHAQAYGEKAHALFIRQQLRSLKEVEDSFQLMLSGAFGGGLRVNRQDHDFRLPNGASIEFAPLNDVEDLAKLQGRSFSMIVADEYGNFSPAQMKYVDALRANLRAGNTPVRMVLLANPGGRGHQSIKGRFIDKLVPWRIGTIDADEKNNIPGTDWLLCPASFTTNEHLPQTYSRDLYAAAHRDKELYRAWAKGEWNIARGAMFGDCIDENTHMIHEDEFKDWQRKDRGLYSFVACDWGQSAPSVAFGCKRLLAPRGRFPRGSLILLDEVTSAEPDDLSVGRNWSLGRLADNMGEMCDRWGIYRRGVIDDARGLGTDETLIKGMAQPPHRFSFKRPTKNRRSGWALIREMLTNAKEKNGKPGLWISKRCKGWWATVPLLPRDPINPEDVDTRAIDHWGDASRYAVTHDLQPMRILDSAASVARGRHGPGGTPGIL